MSGEQTDRRFMQMALNMARRGLGTTAPNPGVGAVIVDDRGVILGRGWTQPGGRPHAEVEALARAGDRARGATLYVTLEPCSHTGKSPPCADAVIRAGVRRVVVGLRDPDKRVAGRGIERLQSAGIEVVENVLAARAHRMTLGHILRVTENRPFVQLKLATSRDGLVASGDGKPVWVTGEEARARGHLLRAQADAILVGIGTVLADDPSLDCRLPGLSGQSPQIVVLDNRCRLPVGGKIVESGRPVTLAATMRVGACDPLSKAGVHVFMLPEYDHVPLAALLENLSERGVTRLLVEGGPRVWRSFLDAGLVDEVVLFRGTQRLDGRGLLPFVDRGLDLLRERGFQQLDRRAVGRDEMQILTTDDQGEAASCSQE